MAGWDTDSPQLRENLVGTMRRIRDAARRRDVLTVAVGREWHHQIMAGLHVPVPEYVGGFRGEDNRKPSDGGHAKSGSSKLKNCRVTIGSAEGVPPSEVAGQLQVFESRLRRVIEELDQTYPIGTDLDNDGLSSVLDVAAWAHAEWVRIHPFANGSGRTARLWANAILMRYGVPPFVRLRPRPDAGYGAASAHAMQGNWQATARVFRQMLQTYLGERE